MNWSVDPPIRVGHRVFAAVAERATEVYGIRAAGTCLGTKRPVLILVLERGQVRALDVTGRTLDLAAVERSFPQAVEHLRALVQDAPSTD